MIVRTRRRIPNVVLVTIVVTALTVLLSLDARTTTNAFVRPDVWSSSTSSFSSSQHSPFCQPVKTRLSFLSESSHVPVVQQRLEGSTTLWAKKKKNAAAAAALEALEAMEGSTTMTTTTDADEPLSKKELIEMERKQKKQGDGKKKKMSKKEELLARALANEGGEADKVNGVDDAVATKKEKSEKKLSKKEEMLQKALEMEKIDEDKAVLDDSDEPKLSKKELKAMKKKKEEKMATKMEKKAEGDDGDTASDDENEVHAPLNGDSVLAETELPAPPSVEVQEFAEKPKLSRKEELLMKALELEKMDEDNASAADDDDEPKLSKKELKALKKKEEKLAAKMEKKMKKKAGGDEDDTASDDEDEVDVPLNGDNVVAETELPAPPSEKVQEDANKPKLSRKEEMLMKALQLEKMDEDNSSVDDDDEPKLSAKELKALKKKEEKLAAKMEKKKKKKAEGDDLDEEEEDEEEPVINEASVELDVEETASETSDEAELTVARRRQTLEEKVRKERPPPRIRIMESSQPGYTSLRLENVGITFRNQEVLKDVTWGVQTGDRIGLVGANGAGKTTQIRIMAGELEPTTGDVVKSSKDLRVAVLRQEFVDELVPERTLREEFLSVFSEENAILQELRAAETELESLPPDDADRMQEILDRMQELQNKAENKGVYALESRVQKVMDLMGFTEDESEGLVASFSGGWKMRIGLGKVLLKDPNVLLLDEPTNHLDLESVEWMEQFLREQNIPMVIVSHDREFLDQVCTKIVDAEGGTCNEYDGNYSRFLQLKKARMDAWQAAYAAQEKRLREDRQWINKFRLKQPQAVKQREAKLEKFMKSEDYVKKPPFLGKPFKFRFPEGPRISPEVAEVKGMSHSYETGTSLNRLFDNVEVFIEKGDRIAVVGPNGSGKSTLLRLLTGREKPDEGTAGIVGANVVMNYFEQNQADALDLDKTVLETIQGASNGQSYNELRAYLGQFLFKGDAVDKKVRNLSGGEKARLSLCCMMLRPANFLILDEPTNHLDIPAKEMLEEALQHYAGSVMIVSHDRYFISKVATTIIAIEDKKLVKYQGDYKFYLERSKDIKEKVEARHVAGVERIGSAPVINLEEAQKSKKNFGGAKTAHMVNRKDKGVKNAKRLQPNT